MKAFLIYLYCTALAQITLALPVLVNSFLKPAQQLVLSGLLKSPEKTITVSTFHESAFKHAKTSIPFVINYSSLSYDSLNECQTMSSDSNSIQITRENFNSEESVFCAIKLFRKEECSHFSQYVRINSEEFNTGGEWDKDFDEPFASYKVGCSNIYVLHHK